MKVSFPYEEKSSSIFGAIKRPIAKVRFWSKKYSRWLEYTMIVDTGADYTLLPFSKAKDLGIDLEKDCQRYASFGIGGAENVYFSEKRIKIEIGKWEKKIPVGFLEREDISPLLGRQECLDIFDLLFSRFVTHFSPVSKTPSIFFLP